MWFDKIFLISYIEKLRAHNYRTTTDIRARARDEREKDRRRENTELFLIWVRGRDSTCPGPRCDSDAARKLASKISRKRAVVCSTKANPRKHVYVLGLQGGKENERTDAGDARKHPPVLARNSRGYALFVYELLAKTNVKNESLSWSFQERRLWTSLTVSIDQTNHFFPREGRTDFRYFTDLKYRFETIFSGNFV